MGAKWAAMTMPKGAKLDNDSSHNFADPNGGGGPAAPVVRNAKPIPNAHRGGPYQSGQRQYTSTSIRGTVGGKGNPAGRGNVSPVGRQSFPSETRVPGHGGSPQQRTNLPSVAGRGGFGNDGKSRTVNQYANANPKPGAGNVGGRMATRITGRFNNKSKGTKSTGTVGSYGDRAPITSNT